MPLDSLSLSTFLPAPPAQVWSAWVDGDQHAAMTGAGATGDARVGGAFTAWDGYIEGTNLVLESPTRIVQAWRTSQFAPTDADSRLEIHLAPEGDGTRLTLVHSGIPAGQGQSYEGGWEEHYFQPMRAFFARD